MQLRRPVLAGGVLLVGGIAFLAVILTRRPAELPSPPSIPPAPGILSPSSPSRAAAPEPSQEALEKVRGRLAWIRDLDSARRLTQVLPRLEEILELESAVEHEDASVLKALFEILGSGSPRAQQLAALLLGRLKTAEVQAQLAGALRGQTTPPAQYAILWAVGLQAFQRGETRDQRRAFWKDRLAQVTMGEGVPWSEAYEGQYDPDVLAKLENRAVNAKTVVAHFGADPKSSSIDHAETRAAALEILRRNDANTPMTKNLLLRLMAKQWFQDDCAEALLQAFLSESQKGFSERYLQLMELNETSEKVCQSLIDYATAPKDPALREKAVLALATKRSPSAQAWFVQTYAGAKDASEKRLAILGLGRYQDAPSLPVLSQVVQRESSPELRQMSVRILARYPDTSTGALLRQIAAQDPDAGVRLETLRRLGDQEKWGSGDLRLLKSIEETDPDANVRAEAAKWLRSASGPSK